jgi:hypothetical protein
MKFPGHIKLRIMENIAGWRKRDLRKINKRIRFG